MYRVKGLIYLLLLAGCSSNLTKGVESYQAGQYSQAKSYFLQASKEKALGSNYWLGLSYETEGDWVKAEHWYRIAIIDDNSPGAMYQVAIHHLDEELKDGFFHLDLLYGFASSENLDLLIMASRWDYSPANEKLKELKLQVPYADLKDQFLATHHSDINAMVRLGTHFYIGSRDEESIKWFYLAARWGDEGAARYLVKLEAEIPYPDLLENKINREIEAERVQLVLVNSMASTAIKVWGPKGSANTYKAPVPVPIAPISAPIVFTAPAVKNSKTGVYGDQQKDPKRCSSDVSCGIGNQCIKAPGKSFGACMEVTDKSNVYMPDANSAFYQNARCIFNSDCEVGYICNKEYKACIKKH